jgi:hypothetical protein
MVKGRQRRMERCGMREQNNINIKHLTHNTFPLFLSDLLIIFPWIKFSPFSARLCSPVGNGKSVENF